MRRKLVSIIAVCFLPVIAAAQHSPTDDQIRAAIAKLGVRTDEKGFAEFEVLYHNPRRSAELLIRSLQPVKRGQYLTGTHPQVVWNIRALRSLTGLDFRAKTRAELTEDEAHFLALDNNGTVLFFGTWMSRDRVWVAPMDAQKAIIKSWQEWLVKYGEHFSYVNDRNFDDWYF
jgi:hypothetical protein